jgi:hypothetical protein
MIRAMSDAPPFGDVKPVSAREWEDPKVVPANEITKWMEEGWEPCGHVMMPATDQKTGAKGMILACSIKRRYSPVRAAIESATKKIVGARVVTPPINGHGR